MRFEKCLAMAIVLLFLHSSFTQSQTVVRAEQQQAPESAAFSTLEREAEAGDASAQNRLGNVYVDGSDAPRDYKEAARWYSAAAAQGSANAQFMLGFLLNNGIGVPQDYTEAAKQYRAAAEQGHIIAQNNLAALYQHGRGVRKDMRQAMEWYRASAERGNIIA